MTRDDVYLQTKYVGMVTFVALIWRDKEADDRFTSLDGQDRSQPLPYDATAPVTTQVQQSVARSLANLGVEKIDAVVLHSPLRTRTVSRARATRGMWSQSWRREIPAHKDWTMVTAQFPGLYSAGKEDAEGLES